MGIVFLPSENMWDTWIYQSGEDYHLFFLSSGDIGRAISQDLIHWKPLAPIENTAGHCDWDKDGMRMTGSVSKVGQMYYLCYGSGDGTPIGLLESRDLLSWQRHGSEPVLQSKKPYGEGDHWRDLSAYCDSEKGIWHGYLFAIDGASGHPCIAHVTSEDYLSWRYHDPIFVSKPYDRSNDGFVYLEVPDYFQLGESRYMLFSSIRSRKETTSGRRDAAGTWYLRSDSPDGSWYVPEKPLLLGSGRGRFDHYVGRTTMFGGVRLLYHHTWGQGTVSWATPKQICASPDGTLHLEYWNALDSLIEGTLLSEPQVGTRGNNLSLFGPHMGDFMLTSTANVSQVRDATLVWHHSFGSIAVASGLRFDSAESTIAMVALKYSPRSVAEFNANTHTIILRDDFQFERLDFGSIHIRIMSRAHQAEVYINDVWIFSMDMSDLPQSGDFGMFCTSGTMQLANVLICNLESL